MRCILCGTDEYDHYDQVLCPLGGDTYSSTQKFTPIPVPHIDSDRMRGPSDWDRECQESGRLNRNR